MHMMNTSEILETLQMIDHQKLDVRTITMGVSLFSCVTDDEDRLCVNIYDRITRRAEHLVQVGREIEREIGVPIVNKRISVTPAALVCGAAKHPVKVARALDRAAKATGVDFIGGYSALVHKAMTEADRRLIESIPEALSTTEYLCSSVNVGSTRGHQHGCRPADGRRGEADRRADCGSGRPGLRKTGGVLQCRGGQSLHGRRVSRSRGG